jgi:hypothetical protein
VRIDETQLELLPVGLRSRTDGTVDLVVQPGEGAPRPTLILVLILAASGDFTSESGIRTDPKGDCADRSREH